MPRVTDGEDGLLALYRAYLAVLTGAEMPHWLNSSLLAFIPKTSPGATGQPHEATPSNFRPMSLSSTCQKLITKAVNATLETIAQQVVRPSQHGFVHGRRMGHNILLSLSAMEKALILGQNSFGTAPFDISAAFPSVSSE